MKRTAFLLLSLFGFAFFFAMCGSVNKSENAADEFYRLVKEKDYDALVELIDENALENHPSNVWTDLLKAKEEYWGDYISHKRTAFSANTENGQTTTQLDFTVEHQKGTLYERLKFVQRDDKMKIFDYQYNSVKSDLD